MQFLIQNRFTNTDVEKPIYNKNDNLNNNELINSPISKYKYSQISPDIISMPQSPIVNNIEHYRNIYASPENFIKRQVNYEKMKVFDEKFRKEIERRKTFKNFPKHLEHLIIPMAKSGFYYIGNEKETDKVKCIFCQGILHKWNKNDVPERDHKKNYPTCPLLLNLNVGNVSVEENSEKHPSIDPDLNCGERIFLNVISTSENNYSSTLDLLELDIETREKTFEKLEHLKYLVFEGLYVIEKGKLNYLKCCECHHEIDILKNIEKLSHDVFHYKYCSLLKSIDGNINENSLINQSLNECDDMKKINYCNVEYSITDEEIEARMDSRITNEMEKFGQHRDKIKKVITNRLKGTGKDYDSIFEFLQDIKIYREIEIVDCDKFEFVFQDYTCVVCLDNIISVIFLPCGHFKTCQRCSKSLSSCPVCRKLIVKRVFGIRLRDGNEKL